MNSPTRTGFIPFKFGSKKITTPPNQLPARVAPKSAGVLPVQGSISKPTPVAVVAVAPNYDWPGLLKPFKLLARPGDKGLGDIAARLIGHETSDAFKEWFLKIFGKQCGCEQRQAWLNSRFPLSNP